MQIYVCLVNFSLISFFLHHSTLEHILWRCHLSLWVARKLQWGSSSIQILPLFSSSFSLGSLSPHLFLAFTNGRHWLFRRWNSDRAFEAALSDICESRPVQKHCRQPQHFDWEHSTDDQRDPVQWSWAACSPPGSNPYTIWVSREGQETHGQILNMQSLEYDSTVISHEENGEAREDSLWFL